MLNLGPKRAAGIALPRGFEHPQIDAEWDEETQTTALTVEYDRGQLHLDVSGDGLEFHYHRANGDHSDVSPFGRLQAAWLHTGGFAEQGGVSAMTGAANSVTAVQSTIGLRASTVVGPTENPIRASGMIGWQHSWSGDNSIAVALPGGPDYVIGGASLGRDAMVAEVEVSLDVNPLTRVSLALRGSVSEAGFDQSIRLGLVGRF